MPETTAREQKLLQYLNEAHGKEEELVTALQAHLAMTTRPAYRKRLEEHLAETRAQSRNLERRIAQLGGSVDQGVVTEVAETAQAVASRALSLAKGQLHALRGTGEAEKMLKNAKTEYFNEHEEIATYLAIETLAEALGDDDTARLAREHRRQEERMAAFLERQIPVLTKAVVTEEIPPRERRPAGQTRTVRSRSRVTGSGGAGGAKRAGGAGAKRGSGGAKSAGAAGGSGRTRPRAGATRARTRSAS